MNRPLEIQEGVPNPGALRAAPQAKKKLGYIVKNAAGFLMKNTKRCRSSADTSSLRYSRDGSWHARVHQGVRRQLVSGDVSSPTSITKMPAHLRKTKQGVRRRVAQTRIIPYSFFSCVFISSLLAPGFAGSTRSFSPLLVISEVGLQRKEIVGRWLGRGGWEEDERGGRPFGPQPTSSIFLFVLFF